jgi:hypothetical protein
MQYCEWEVGKTLNNSRKKCSTLIAEDVLINNAKWNNFYYRFALEFISFIRMRKHNLETT